MQRIADLTPITSETTINNEDITITSNGTYTAAEGYTGIGTATVSIPITPKLNVAPLGVTIDENGIASDFKAVTGFSNYGGFAINTGGKFLNAVLPHQNQISFYLAFRTPAEKQAIVFCGASDSATLNSQQWQISIDSGFTGISINATNYGTKTAAYAFEPDTDYIVRYTQTYSGSWLVLTAISTDGGETYTQIKSESGRFDTDSYDIVDYCRLTQFGYVNVSGTMTACTASIDLKKTGFKNTTNNFVYMFAE